ncbi:N-acetyllactosaminide beta-1,6-N-acetylglucosaminyl-transferase-like [Liolophura sinensis]|uniref:N-acetyllactosaminide beta-1,6-N-acetylglucosaminyl-transferase-like n=1 Tax=Liolophura sinensis TaxID=3198878 RepID=UPI003158C239
MTLFVSTPRSRSKKCFRLLLLTSIVSMAFLGTMLYTKSEILTNSRRVIGSAYWILAQHSDEIADGLLVKMASKNPVEGAQCSRLINGDDFNTTKTESNMFRRGRSRDIATFSKLIQTGNCQHFQEVRGYIMKPGSLEEKSFPISFSIIVFKKFYQIERLLRAIYRPQNQYCIHVDLKSDDELKYNLANLTSCFDNVFISSKTINVQWGKFSVLEAELICMEDLLKRPRWKYFINLTGQEFPLKTNWEIVRILKAYNGANDIAATIRRWVNAMYFTYLKLYYRTRHKEPAPHNITIVKGPVHTIMSRAFVDFIMHDKKALDFLDWTNGTYVPDETFFATLQHNPDLGTPGAFRGEEEIYDVKPQALKHSFYLTGTNEELEKKKSMTRYKLWKPIPCNGTYVRQICIFAKGDLPRLAQAPQLFANKFYFDYGELAYECLDELHWNRTRDEYLYGLNFNTTFYENLPTVRQAVNTGRDSDI